MNRSIPLFLIAGVLLAGHLHAAVSNLVVYDDSSKNGFNQACSFNASPNFAETTVVHSGSAGISYAAANFGAISWCTPATLATSDYSGLTLWVNGGNNGGQNLELVFGLGGDSVAQISLASLIGAPIAANSWTLVTFSFDAAATSYSGNFDQLSIQDNSGNATASAQPIVYFDDVTLVARVPTLPDPIFKDGFDGSNAVPSGAMTIETNISACSGLTAERYTWQDSSAQSRSATLSHNDTGNNGARGMLCDFTYHTDAATTRDVQALSASGAGGFGYIVSHLYNEAAPDQIGVPDASPLGLAYAGSYTRVLSGRHHAILRFQLNYPRWYCTMSNPPDGNCTSATTTYPMPVTIDWLFATGRDHPLWSVSYDLSGAPVNAIDADSRAPYGEMAFDGAANGGFGDTVMGVAWGDHYKFSNTGANPVSFNSPWDWSQANTIPYVYLWTQNVDAEMGIVQTEDISRQDAGGYYGQGSWGHVSNGSNTCLTSHDGDGNYIMPCSFNWPYQSINYALDPAHPNATTNDKRLAWGAEFGFLGQSPYAANDGSNAVGWPHVSYSTFIALDKHSKTPSSKLVGAVENSMASMLTASVGTVLISGPAGVDSSAGSRSYQPAGYNRVYATWDINVSASANKATFALNASGSGLKNPIFVLHGYTAALPSSITLDGVALVADTDYFATLDTTGHRLWLTVNRAWSGSHSVVVTP